MVDRPGRLDRLAVTCGHASATSHTRQQVSQRERNAQGSPPDLDRAVVQVAAVQVCRGRHRVCARKLDVREPVGGHSAGKHGRLSLGGSRSCTTGGRHAKAQKRKSGPFWLARELVAQDGDPVDDAAVLEVGLELLWRRRIVDLANEQRVNRKRTRTSGGGRRRVRSEQQANSKRTRTSGGGRRRVRSEQQANSERTASEQRANSKRTASEQQANSERAASEQRHEEQGAAQGERESAQGHCDRVST